MPEQRSPAAQWPLACPICSAGLTIADRAALCCTTGHSFDRAREGYYNLLAVQHKASADPGDSKDMVAARRRFLASGAYRPIAARTAQIVLELALRRDVRQRLAVVDAGCGEGSYLDAVAQALAAAGLTHVRCAGVDISKWAVRAAAKRNPDCFLAVASNRRMPFPAASVDCLLSMFGFALWERFAEAQPSGGHVLLVDPGPDHLVELRRIIYQSVRATAPPALHAGIAARYVLASEEHLRFEFTLADTALIADLLTMTPHAHRATAEGRARLAALPRLELTGDVVFRLLRKA